MTAFPRGRYLTLVADTVGTRDAIARNAQIGNMRHVAMASNIGEPAMVVVMVPAGTEDEVHEIVKVALEEGASA